MTDHEENGVTRVALVAVGAALLLSAGLAAGLSVSVEDRTVAPGESVTISPETDGAFALTIDGIPDDWAFSASGGTSTTNHTDGNTTVVRWLAPGEDVTLELDIPASAAGTTTLTASVIDGEDGDETEEIAFAITVEESTADDSDGQGGLGGDGDVDIETETSGEDSTSSATETVTDGPTTSTDEPTEGAATAGSTDEDATTGSTTNTPSSGTGPGFGAPIAGLAVALLAAGIRVGKH